MAGGESKGSRRYDKENLLWQSTVVIKPDPVGLSISATNAALPSIFPHETCAIRLVAASLLRGPPSVLFDVKTIEGCAMMAKPLLWNIDAGGMSPVFMVDNAEARDALVAHVRRDFLYKHPAFA